MTLPHALTEVMEEPLRRMLKELTLELQQRMSVTTTSTTSLSARASSSSVAASGAKKRPRDDDESHISKDVALMHSPRVDLLDEDDWSSILHPMCEVGPYVSSVLAPTEAPTSPRAAYSLMDAYVRCRCAELPMRLQTEGLAMYRHERSLRQFMKELVALSEFVVLLAAPSTSSSSIPEVSCRVVMEKEVPNESHSSTSQPSCTCMGADEVERRFQRCLDRIRELEKLIRHESRSKLRCAQRMFLLGQLHDLLLQRLRRERERLMGNTSIKSEG